MQRRLERDSAFALFTYGFRPFFLGASFWAVAAVALWIGALAGLWTLGEGYGALEWHAHEMIFGYTGAVVAGFLLTAIPNWTGRLPVAGWRLVLIFALWGVARLAFLATGIIGPLPAVVLDSLFLPCLLVLMGREIVVGRNWRNLKPLILVTVLAAADIAFHAEVLTAGSANYGNRVGIAALLGLIMLIGGRVVPSFTHTWLMRNKAKRLPVSFDRFDVVTLLASAAALISWIVVPQAAETGVLFLGAALLHCVRLWRWTGLQTWREPLVFVLHLAYAFVPVGFFLGAIGALVPNSFAGTEPLHAWTVGAIGLMTLAIMTRASRGHTGRALSASALTILIYGAIVVAALLRIGAGLVPGVHGPLVTAAGIAWIAAFMLFILEYGPMLLGRRVEHAD